MARDTMLRKDVKSMSPYGRVALPLCEVIVCVLTQQNRGAIIAGSLRKGVMQSPVYEVTRSVDSTYIITMVYITSFLECTTPKMFDILTNDDNAKPL